MRLMKSRHSSLAAFQFDGSHAQVVPDGALMVSIMLGCGEAAEEKNG